MNTKLNKINNHVYWTSPYADLDRPVIGIICGSKSTALFDACSSTRHARDILECISNLNIKKPTYITISHSHSDHWFGLPMFSANALCSIQCMNNIMNLMDIDWSSKGYHNLVKNGKGSVFLEKILNKEYGLKRKRIKLKAPTISFKGEIIIDLGNIHVLIKEIASSHSNDCIYGYIPEEKIIFLGDMLYLKDRDESEIERILDHLKNVDAKYFIDSHIDKVLSYKEMEEHYRKYYKEEVEKGTSYHTLQPCSR